MTEQPQSAPSPPPAPPPTPAAATATDAQNQMDVLTGDKAWVARFLRGDVAAATQFKTRTGAIVNGGTADDVVASIMGGKAPELGNSEQRQMAAYVDYAREMGIPDGVSKQFLTGEKVSAQEYQAIANLKRELLGNAEFRTAFLNGGVKEKQRITMINAVLVNGVKVEAAS